MVSFDTIFEDQTSGELGLLTFFILVSLYMFVDAGSYPDIIGLYPRALSAIVLICGLLLFVRNLLPAPVQNYVTESGTPLESSTEVAEELPSENSESTDASQSQTEGTSKSQVVLTLLISGYLLLSYFIGMYFATPVFVFVYGLTFRLDWKMTVGLTVLASATAHIFLAVFDAPITSGVLL